METSGSSPASPGSNWRKWFSADRPIQDRGGDRLGRSTFAETIAAAIRGWHARDSLVVALDGLWGSGKSSVKNMVIDALADSDNAAVVVEFNPWEYANREELSAAFFEQIAITVGKADFGGNKSRELSRKWRRYSEYLRFGSEGLSDLMQVLLIGAGVIVTLCSTLLNDVFGLITGAIVTTALAVLKLSSRATGLVSEFFAVRARSREVSVQEAKNDIAETLRQISQPIVIFLDDIDRLTPNETLEIFQLVKANADLPNMIYVTLFDRVTVENNLQAALGAPGRQYLEKITQVVLSIPAAAGRRVREILFEGLDELLASLPANTPFDRQRWGNLFFGGLSHYFRNLRDVNRFLSSLAFQVTMYRSSGSFEVNPVDAIALEVLRLFEPGLFEVLAASKSVLTDGDPLGEAQKSRIEQQVSDVLAAASDQKREVCREIIKQLFPSIEWVFGGMHYTASQEDWDRELRVCSERNFDRYFAFCVVDGDVSQHVVERVLDLVGNREQLVEELTGINESGLLSPLLERLDAYKREIARENVTDFITALFDIGELLPRERSDGYKQGAAMHALRIAYWCLRGIDVVDERMSALGRALEFTNGISLPVRFVGLECQRARRKPNSDDHLFPDERYDELKSLALKIVLRAREEKRLTNTPELSYVLHCWAEWGDHEDVRQFCSRMTRTSDGIIRLSRAFLSRSTSHSVGDHVGKEHWYVRLGDVERFVSVDELRKGLDRVEKNELSGEDELAVGQLQRAIARRMAGKPDFGGGGSDDDDDDAGDLRLGRERSE